MNNDIKCNMCSHKEVCSYKEDFMRMYRLLIGDFNTNNKDKMFSMELGCNNYTGTANRKSLYGTYL